MQWTGHRFLLTASDVVDACSCPYLPVLERARARGLLPRTPPPSTPEQDLVLREAALHERRAWAELAPAAAHPVEIDAADAVSAAADTKQALHAGADLVYHGVLLDGPWLGRPDVGTAAGAPLQQADQDQIAAATRLARALDESTLAVQGPPGTGKTTLAGRVVADLLLEGRRVGVTAQSHKVIGNLLGAID